jgi:hypothetical protein
MNWYQLKVSASGSFSFRHEVIPLEPTKFKNYLINKIRIYFEENESTSVRNQKMDDYLIAMINTDDLLNHRDLVLFIQDLFKIRAKKLDWAQVIKEISK